MGEKSLRDLFLHLYQLSNSKLRFIDGILLSQHYRLETFGAKLNLIFICIVYLT